MLNESLILSRAKWLYFSKCLSNVEACIERAIYDLTPINDLRDAYTLYDITINDLVAHFKNKIWRNKDNDTYWTGTFFKCYRKHTRQQRIF